jgi:hypothetical protein
VSADANNFARPNVYVYITENLVLSVAAVDVAGIEN